MIAKFYLSRVTGLTYAKSAPDVQAHLPDEHTEPELHQLVKMYQKHNHSKTYRKYRNVSCWFNFGQFFTSKTMIAEPLSTDLDDDITIHILDRRIKILSSVKKLMKS